MFVITSQSHIMKMVNCSLLKPKSHPKRCEISRTARSSFEIVQEQIRTLRMFEYPNISREDTFYSMRTNRINILLFTTLDFSQKAENNYIVCGDDYMEESLCIAQYMNIPEKGESPHSSLAIYSQYSCAEVSHFTTSSPQCRLLYANLWGS